MTKRSPVILLVDDDARVRQDLRARLLRAIPGAIILLVATAEEALRVIVAEPVEVIISDQHMPGIDGETLLTRAKALRPSARRILLSGVLGGEFTARGIASGAFEATLTKPVDGDELGESVSALLDKGSVDPPGSSSESAGTSPDSGAAPAAGGQFRRLLIVDDIVEVANLFAALANRLSPLRVDVEVETNPRRAFERLATESFDAIITDYRMPNVNGVDLLIEAKARQPNARRVLITGYNEVPEDLDRLKLAGIDAYVHKPIPAQDALILLRASLSHDPKTMNLYRSQARILEGQATSAKRPLELDDV